MAILKVKVRTTYESETEKINVFNAEFWISVWSLPSRKVWGLEKCTVLLSLCEEG